MPNKSQRFSYRSLDELKDDISRRQLDLPISDDFSVLARPLQYGRLNVPNRMAVQPMEGCDAAADGSPTDLTVRRYRRFAAGGAGMIWFEACAVVPEGRANPRQLRLHEDNLEAFATMVRAVRAAAQESVGQRPALVLQLTHSGRYSRPGAVPAPIIAHHSPVLDPRHNLPGDYPLITDEQLDELQEQYVKAALLAERAGFDAVDIKSCHRYLLSELLASFTRQGRYGGSFENRTRMLRQTAARVRQALGDRVEVTCRINAYDAIPHPYGWGVDKDDARKYDLTEPLRLMGDLAADGMGGINITIANPYFNPYVNRPADWMIADWPDPPEHPLEGVARLMRVVRDVQRAFGKLPVVGSGYSWLRQYYPYFAAGAVEQGWASMAGLGRGALAYPDFAKDILQHGGMDARKVCVACSSCTQIMRDGGTSGCVIRDREVYGPIYRAGRDLDPRRMRELAAGCRGCADAMCTAACPAGVDVPGFLGALADGDERRAYEILTSSNVLPEICGWVCPVEVQCQGACIQNQLAGQGVPIARLQRYLAARAVREGWAALSVPPKWSGRTVAIVGTGPAGMSAAADLLRRGHRVVMFDRASAPGGKLAGVIPPGRLDPKRTAAEIAALFAKVPSDRLTWRYGTALGQGMTLDDLAGQGYDAIILAFGLGNGVGLDGRDRPEGVMDAEAFLEHMNRNADHLCSDRVAVIGGGNTAIDAAICASRRGAGDVYLVYRRSYGQMPAWPAQRDEALRVGVHLLALCQPEGYVTDAAGRLEGVRIVRTELGEPDASGRRRPVETPEGRFVLKVSLALEATGQRMDKAAAEALCGIEMSAKGLIKVDPTTFRTSRAGVWAAGDAVNGGATVVQALAEGKKAAADINNFWLTG